MNLRIAELFSANACTGGEGESNTNCHGFLGLLPGANQYNTSYLLIASWSGCKDWSKKTKMSNSVWLKQRVHL